MVLQGRRKHYCIGLAEKESGGEAGGIAAREARENFSDLFNFQQSGSAVVTLQQLHAQAASITYTHLYNLTAC